MTTNRTTLEALNTYEAGIKLWEVLTDDTLIEVKATHDPTRTAAAIEGANIWQDVIYGAMDADATEARWTDANSNDFIGTDGLHYGYRPQAANGPWIIVED